MPISPMSPGTTSFIRRSWMNFTAAAGQRFSICPSRAYEAGGSTIRLVSRLGDSSASTRLMAGPPVVLGAEAATNARNARMLTSSMTGVLDASRSKPVSTADDALKRLGIEQPDLRLHRKACDRSCMIEAFAVILRR